MKRLIWKVCGLRDSVNIREVSDLNPGMLGFIFYTGSPRYADPELNISVLKSLAKTIKKVGVFVNEDNNRILEICENYNLDFAQLHGNESPGQCKWLMERELGIIKAFSIDSHFDFSTLKDYEKYVEYFLFDTKGVFPGGNSFPFDWRLLDSYCLKTPFLLSGGISLDNFKGIEDIHHPMLAGIDVNSRFEIKPGLKDLGKLKVLKILLEEIIN
ncbi:phosphoribosylanthranilate isomerase [Bacteroidota bacterium]